MDATELIHQQGKCCITDKPLNTSKHINMIQLRFKASWKYPVWGNILQKIPAEMAVAFIHDDAILPSGRLCNPVKFAVEIKDQEIIYHEVPKERTCRQCGCTDHNACTHEVFGPCWWVEEDLCSHCQMLHQNIKK